MLFLLFVSCWDQAQIIAVVGQNATGQNTTGQNATGQNATGQNATPKMPRGQNATRTKYHV